MMPAIHDISTDTANPPAFVDVLPLRTWASNPPEYAGPHTAVQQHAAYPDIHPVIATHARSTVHAVVRDVIARRGWRLVGDDEIAGRLEAVAVTPVLRFRDDVVVRLTDAGPGPGTGTGTRIDVRSKSRMGRNDFGTNARRVRALLADIAQALGGSAR